MLCMYYMYYMYVLHTYIHTYIVYKYCIYIKCELQRAYNKSFKITKILISSF